LRNLGIDVEERDVGQRPLTVAELDALIGSRDHREFLNPRNELYRERGMKDDPPGRAQAMKLLSENPNLMKRPILVAGKRTYIGFDEKAWKELSGA
jgi:arsenate reductase-like glutaredoxin family protein